MKNPKIEKTLVLANDEYRLRLECVETDILYPPNENNILYLEKKSTSVFDSMRFTPSKSYIECLKSFIKTLGKKVEGTENFWLCVKSYRITYILVDNTLIVEDLKLNKFNEEYYIILFQHPPNEYTEIISKLLKYICELHGIDKEEYIKGYKNENS